MRDPDSLPEVRSRDANDGVPGGSRLLLSWRRSLALGLATVLLVGCTPQPVLARDTAVAQGQTQIGWTHERWSPDGMRSLAHADAAMKMLQALAPVQNTNIYGWGMPDPSPSVGNDQFDALDRRVAMMVRTSRQPVITLCCAPERMKPAVVGQTAKERFESAPASIHFDDFAKLAGRIAARYPDVRHFMVWNELKGFWDKQGNRWNAELYVDLYNRVYREIKAVRPDAQVGGPYVVVDSFRAGTPEARWFGSEVHGEWGRLDRRALDAISYWLTHKAGADFVAVDGSVMPKDRRLDVEPAAGLEKFVAVHDWLRRRTSLPVWWAEFYPVPPGMSPAEAVPQLTKALALIEAAGASVVLFWDPACRNDVSYGAGACLWTDDPVQPLKASDWSHLLTRRPTAGNLAVPAR